MLNYKASLSVTPVSSCCVEIAGMLICSLEFYPALSELLFFFELFPLFSAPMRYSNFLQGAQKNILKQSSRGAVLTSACDLLQCCQHNTWQRHSAVWHLWTAGILAQQLWWLCCESGHGWNPSSLSSLLVFPLHFLFPPHFLMLKSVVQPPECCFYSHYLGSSGDSLGCDGGEQLASLFGCIFKIFKSVSSCNNAEEITYKSGL